jgi:integrase
VKSYESYLKNHIIPELGHIKLGDLTPQDVQRFLNSRARAGRSPRTVQYLRAILQSALAEAAIWGYIERNSASLAKPPKMERREVSVLSAAEAKRLIESTADDRLGNLFAIALYTGLRQGELLGLRWPDIDLAQGTLHVRKALQKQDREAKFIEPKTERSRRRLSLPATAVSILALQQERVDAMRRHAGSAWQDWDLVFPSQLGTPLDGSNVTHHLQHKLAEAGLPRVRFHDLRHTCSTLLLEQGVQDRVLEQLGHSQITLTLNTYSHVRPAMLSATAAALDRALGSPS